MSELFAISNELGSFDFFTNLIEIRNYTRSAQVVLEQSLAESLTTEWLSLIHI